MVEALSYGKRGLGELRCAGQRPAKIVWKGNALRKRNPLVKRMALLCQSNPFGEKDGKILLNKFKRFGGNEKNTYLCTVKNASEGLKSALNAISRFFERCKVNK